MHDCGSICAGDTVEAQAMAEAKGSGQGGLSSPPSASPGVPAGASKGIDQGNLMKFGHRASLAHLVCHRVPVLLVSALAEKRTKVYTVRRHDGSLCTQKQCETAVEVSGVLLVIGYTGSLQTVKYALACRNFGCSQTLLQRHAIVTICIFRLSP